MLFLSIAFSVLFPTTASLSLEEKVGQMLMAHCYTEKDRVDEAMLINDIGIGGIVYYNWANQLSSIQQVRSLSDRLQTLSTQNRIPIPLFLAVDQEGEPVMRCKEGDFTPFPGNAALGMTNDPSLARKSVKAMGQELLAAGINMNLAPVVDLNDNPHNPVIGIRSFGTLEQVLTYSAEALEGYHEAHIITTLKHFPGHGNTVNDSHYGTAILNVSLEELKQKELQPFALLAKNTDAIMLGHLRVIALDPDVCATLSGNVIAYLRETLGFKGVIITDSLNMEGLLLETQGSIEEAVIRSIEAGCDILLLGGKLLIGDKKGFEFSPRDIKRVQESILEAVRSGRISEDRINDSVDRILSLKSRYISRLPPSSLSVKDLEGHQKLAKEIAQLAVRSIGNSLPEPLSLREKKIAVIAPSVLKKEIISSSLPTLGQENKLFFYDNLNFSRSEQKAILELCQETDTLIICSYNAWKNPEQKKCIQSLIATGKPVIIVALRDPMDSELFPEALLRFTTYSPSAPSIEAVCDSLKL